MYVYIFGVVAAKVPLSSLQKVRNPPVMSSQMFRIYGYGFGAKNMHPSGYLNARLK